METIAYVAPSAAGTIEDQIELVRPLVSDVKWIKVDRPKKPGDPIPRTERDFMFAHMLRSAAENVDGKPDRLALVSVDVLGDSRAEVTELFSALVRLGVPLISLTDGLDGDATGTEYVVKWIKALDRAEGRWQRRKKASRPKPGQRKGTPSGGRPKALADAEVQDVVQMKDVEGKTWPQIEAHYASLGRTVKQSTLRAYYAAAKSE